ncbi:hypothetical protein D3C79_841670 [compost metagenome]
MASTPRRCQILRYSMNSCTALSQARSSEASASSALASRSNRPVASAARRLRSSLGFWQACRISNISRASTCASTLSRFDR